MDNKKGNAMGYNCPSGVAYNGQGGKDNFPGLDAVKNPDYTKSMVNDSRKGGKGPGSKYPK